MRIEILATLLLVGCLSADIASTNQPLSIGDQVLQVNPTAGVPLTQKSGTRLQVLYVTSTDGLQVPFQRSVLWDAKFQSQCEIDTSYSASYGYCVPPDYYGMLLFEDRICSLPLTVQQNGSKNYIQRYIPVIPRGASHTLLAQDLPEIETTPGSALTDSYGCLGCRAGATGVPGPANPFMDCADWMMKAHLKTYRAHRIALTDLAKVSLTPSP